MCRQRFWRRILQCHVSYFVGLDADESNPRMLLAGDRNIVNGKNSVNGILELTTNNPAKWTRAMHNRAGNVGLADGSVQQVDIPGLQKLIEKTGVATRSAASRRRRPSPPGTGSGTIRRR